MKNTIFVKPRVSSSLYSSSPAAKKGIMNFNGTVFFPALFFPVLFALLNIYFIMTIKHNLDKSFQHQYQDQQKQ